MDPDQPETDPKSFTAQERHLLRLYGKLPARGDLLHHQLGRRKYFDSGDFALSGAKKPSTAGVVQTGKEHPLRENISHPSSPVPSDSNVKQSATRERQDSTSSNLAKEVCHLQQETRSDDENANDEKADGEKACNNMPTEFNSLNQAKEEIPIGPVEKPKT